MSHHTALSTVVRINRAGELELPSYTRALLHPEIQFGGPDEFDVGQLRTWIYPGYESGLIGKDVVFRHLEPENMPERCIGLMHLQAIRDADLPFLDAWEGNVLPAWKTVILHGDFPSVSVPYLDRAMRIQWAHLADSHPRFPVIYSLPYRAKLVGVIV